MSNPLPPPDARASLNEHVAAKGIEIQAKYGPHIGWTQLTRILSDRTCVRYPCELAFEATPLFAGEFAHPVGKGSRPENGYTLYVHPALQLQLDRVPQVVLYQLVLVNYGEFASADDAETFGAAALGLPREEYYQALCRVADDLAEFDSRPLGPQGPCPV